MIRFTKEQTEGFIKKEFITCKYCGYNNKLKRFQHYGVCLNCGKVLDEKVYFKAQYYKTKNKSVCQIKKMVL